MEYSVWLDSNKFTYKLLDIRPARIWAELISRCNTSLLKDTLDPWHGATRNIETKIIRFNNIIDQLNTWMIPPLPGYFDIQHPTESCNRLHIHFPEFEAKETDTARRKQLYEYNDLIHQIDLHYRNSKEPFILIAFQTGDYNTMIDDDYQYFNTEFNFGDLTLHYPHVGRHPMELLGANDVNCPPAQIIPQHHISASHCLRFYTGGQDVKSKFKKFYLDSNIQWPYKLDDPRLALGYIKLGSLISINNKPELSKALTIVNNTKSITSWEVKA